MITSRFPVILKFHRTTPPLNLHTTCIFNPSASIAYQKQFLCERCPPKSKTPVINSGKLQQTVSGTVYSIMYFLCDTAALKLLNYWINRIVFLQVEHRERSLHQHSHHKGAGQGSIVPYAIQKYVHTLDRLLINLFC